MKKFNDIKKEVEEQDIVFVASRRLIDTLPLSVIELVLNIAVSKMAIDKNWNPETDIDLETNIKGILKKLTDRQTIQFAFMKATSSKNFNSKTIKESLTTGLGKCLIKEIYSQKLRRTNLDPIRVKIRI